MRVWLAFTLLVCIACGSSVAGGDDDDVPAGACCLADGECQMLTEDLCTDAGGAYQGDDTLCSLVECTRPSGACCRDGVCVILSQEACGADGGVYMGDGTSCDPNPCAPPVAATAVNWGRIRAIYR